MLEVLLEAVIDTAKLVPVLLLVYLLISYLTHHKKNPSKILMGKGKYFGPLFGSILGCVPQCGFSAVMADLYSKRAITIGTLFAVFLTTSDEAVPILIANPAFYKELFIILGIKFLIGLIFGYAIDLLLSYFQNKNMKKNSTDKHDCHSGKKLPPCGCITNNPCDCGSSNSHLCSCEDKKTEDGSQCGCEHHHIDDEYSFPCNCGHHHLHNKDKDQLKDGHIHNENCCADNIFLDAIIHTAKIAIFILIINLILGIVIYYVGMDSFVGVISINSYLQPLVACLIGLIPNCAGSVFLVEIYMAGGLTLPATIAGLSAGSGVGIMVLFKQNKNIKQNLLIVLSLYLIGVVIGLALTPIL
jgi:hypothetical protein